MRLLTVNAGSSSVRLAMVDVAEGVFETRAAAMASEPPPDARSFLADLLRANAVDRLTGVAHRIVHGGERLVEPRLISEQIEAEVGRLSALAPLHNPRALDWVRACRELLGTAMPQVAVFDTAFFADLPPVAATYALPQALTVPARARRYGFHGLAHRAMWNRWCKVRPSPTQERVISLQLGGGCSIAAIHSGRPLDTSMGFSPLEGLMMATRCGDVDTGLLLHLQRTVSWSPERLEEILYRESGLLGVSGISSDMRRLLASNEEAARFAIDLYCYRARKYVGAYLAVLGGADAILFGGGVGENAPAVRERILQGMQWAGISLDAKANLQAIATEARIGSIVDRPSGGRTEVWVLRVNEAKVMAEDAYAVLSAAQKHVGG